MLRVPGISEKDLLMCTDGDPLLAAGGPIGFGVRCLADGDVPERSFGVGWLQGWLRWCAEKWAEGVLCGRVKEGGPHVGSGATCRVLAVRSGAGCGAGGVCWCHGDGFGY